jgi:ubiquinone/menaquinone biosynthesis C-methylase UbiE
MEPPQRKDTWASGAAYEPYVGRWSRLVAREFVAWLTIPQGARWLDIGCGTGALSQSILDVASPREITGIDPSEGHITFARQQVRDRRVSFRLGDAQALPEAPASYDAVVAGLVLNFVPQPSRAVAEMQRMARVGGTVAAYVWDYARQMQLMRYFWMQPWRSTLPRPSWMRDNASPSANQSHSCSCFAPKGCKRSRYV